MNDYISRKAAIDYIERNKHRLGITEANACNFKEILRMQPSVFVREDVHGEWLNFYGDFSVAECSECAECYEVSPDDEPTEEFFETFKLFYKFCPNCGARMKSAK